MVRDLLSVAAAVTMTAAAALVPLVATAPAHAAVCTGTTGVSVVVDYNELGDGVRTGCAPRSGGEPASAIFGSAGFPLQFASSSQGFVCRVTGVPASDPCVDSPPTTAYWSLWWSDGKSGTWSYASRGVNGLRVPNGGYVAFSWHEGSGRAAPPSVAPTVRTATPPKPSATPTKPATKPSPKPRPKPSSTPSVQSSTPAPTVTGSDAPSESATPSDAATPSTSATASADPADPTATVEPSAPAADEVTAGPPADGKAEGAADPDEDGGLPIWLPIGAVVVVAAIGGGLAWRRRIA